MKISKKAYYGLRALVGIAHFGEISAHALAQEENLPEDYLQKILQQLKKSEVISSEKGAGGGYSLAKDAKDISVWEIISTLDGEIVPFAPPKMTSTSPLPQAHTLPNKPRMAKAWRDDTEYTFGYKYS